MSNIFAYEIEIGIFKNKLKNYGMLKERLKLLNTDLEYIENHRYNIRSTALIKERKMQEAILKIKRKHGKNSILKMNNLEEDATTIERNSSIGGHKA